MAMTETKFCYRGEMWKRFPAEADERFVMGVDLGQAQDYTAISVIHWQRRPLDTWSEKKQSGNRYNLLTQDFEETFNVRHLERLPLGTPYPAQVEHVAALMQREPLCGIGELVVDQTGVGAAVADLVDAAGLEPVRVVIGAGFEATKHSPRKFVVPKTELISGLDAALHSGTLRFAAELTEARALADELKDFRRKVSDAGRATYAARGGRHDDLVLSVAIALWWLRRPPAKSSSQFVKGLW